MSHRFLKFSELKRDPALQARVSMDPELVGEYTDAILRGERLPRVSVIFDGMYFYLIDGWHRCAALEAAGKYEVEAEVVEGSYRDAMLASFAANSKNGARRTNADKRQAVERMLADVEWVRCSDNDIAKHCAVSQPFVASVRSSIFKPFEDRGMPVVRTVTRNGTTYAQNVASIGKAARARPAPQSPASQAQNDPEPDAAEQAFGDFDLVAELEIANKEIASLQEQVDALSAGDVAAELAKEIRTRQGIEAQLGLAMEKVGQQDRNLRSFGRITRALRDLLGVESNAGIVDAVRDALRAKVA